MGGLTEYSRLLLVNHGASLQDWRADTPLKVGRVRMELCAVQLKWSNIERGLARRASALRYSDKKHVLL